LHSEIKQEKKQKVAFKMTSSCNEATLSITTNLGEKGIKERVIIEREREIKSEV